MIHSVAEAGRSIISPEMLGMMHERPFFEYCRNAGQKERVLYRHCTGGRGDSRSHMHPGWLIRTETLFETALASLPTIALDAGRPTVDLADSARS